MRDALGPHPRCGVCTIMLLGSRSDRNTTQLYEALRARGVPVLLLSGGANTGFGLAPRQLLPVLSSEAPLPSHRLPSHEGEDPPPPIPALDVAHMVHAVAQQLHPVAQRLVVRIDTDLTREAMLLAHLVISQALCRAHTVLLPELPPIRGNRSAAAVWTAWTRETLRHNTGRRTRSCPARVLQFPALNSSGTASAVAQMPACDAPMAAAASATPSAEHTITTEGTAAFAYMGALAVKDEARLDALFTSNNCSHAYLDFGSNIGVQIRKLYEPKKFAGAKVHPIFDEHFGTVEERCRVCSIGAEPNPRHTERLATVQERLTSRLGAPMHIFRDAAVGNLDGLAQLARHQVVKDRWEDGGASAVASQGAFFRQSTPPHQAMATRAVRNGSQAATTGQVPARPTPDARPAPSPPSGRSLVLVRTLDLARLIHRIRQRIGPDGKILMKLDVEGAEYTLLARLALTGVLCDVDTIMIEWHARYFNAHEAQRVVSGMGLSEKETGKAMVYNWALGTPAAVAKAAATCSRRRVKIVDIDDETFMYDRQPWPELGKDGLCGASSRAKAASSAKRAKSLSDQLSTRLSRQWSRVKRTWHAVYDEFEDEGLLWLLNTFGAIFALACCCCCWAVFGDFTDVEVDD